MTRVLLAKRVLLARLFGLFLTLGVLFPSLAPQALAQGKLPTVSIDLKESDDPSDMVPAIKIVALLTIISVAPAILLMMTSFTRILVVLSFVRQALGTQTMPPNQVIVGLALFLTLFTMGPVLDTIKTKAYEPYVAHHITQDKALEEVMTPVRGFMLKQTRADDLELFLGIARLPRPQDSSKIPMTALMPAFMVSELKTAFQIGFLIYVPFLVIDMVISSVLMAMGMVMLPPTVVSLPFKLILFVLVDGWTLIVENLVKSFKL